MLSDNVKKKTYKQTKQKKTGAHKAIIPGKEVLKL